MKIAIFGCGGTGSEVVKLLKSHNLTLIDFDRIEISNLSRQFFFTKEDVGKYKSETIAKKIGCNFAVQKIEDTQSDFISSFDAIFCCVDNVSGRMELNYLFLQSDCPLLVDCGVEGEQVHAKRVLKSDPCLYCNKELFKVQKEPFLCSIKDFTRKITHKNRNEILKSLIFSEKYANSPPKKIKEDFNSRCPEDLKTTETEIRSISETTAPGTCTVNAICAAFAVSFLFEKSDFNFIFCDLQFEPKIQKLKMVKNSECFLCDFKKF